MSREATIHLQPTLFGEKEKVLVEHGELSASTFRYESGVCALRLKNELGQLVLLPYQGQSSRSPKVSRPRRKGLGQETSPIT